MKSWYKSLLCLCIVSAIFTSNPSISYSSLTNFGGPTLRIDRECINGKLIYIGEPRGGPHMELPSTYQYEHGGINKNGQQQLGRAGPNTPCLVIRSCGTSTCIVPKAYGKAKVFQGTSQA